MKKLEKLEKLGKKNDNKEKKEIDIIVDPETRVYDNLSSDSEKTGTAGKDQDRLNTNDLPKFDLRNECVLNLQFGK
eukprot:CAMPEP_0116960274 /NCGR_PEP_ID=MMETSP0467-20121206/45839_1 /TAXON_ID=283647 /ORGANISM="Mesodinium pulex, Strain SPMC105" /LENGTH=75 /DNA_ID=CAMNT_0004647923 /DNA_START=390 /DNA_END=620 /DNA_ORIENTATION=-